MSYPALADQDGGDRLSITKYDQALTGGNEAGERNIKGRSKMNKEQLERALQR
jgi:hypothetical protein